ncbi:helix-turn-helix domain-containing protein [Streptomyces sp. QTS137]
MASPSTADCRQPVTGSHHSGRTTCSADPRPRPGRWTVYDLIRTRRLPSVTIGRRRRIPASAPGDFIAEQTEQAEQAERAAW